MDLSAIKENSQSTKSELNRKIRAEYIPVRLSIINKSGKLLQIPKEDVYFLTASGEKRHIPSEEEIFKNVKRNGVTRALAWGVPLGVVSFGILAPAAFIWSGAHTKITNGTVKDNLEKNYYQGGHLSPEGGMSTFVYIPEKQTDITKIVLGRVIDVEDSVETEKVIDIQALEPQNEPKK
jgi:hypothetical protein